LNISNAAGIVAGFMRKDPELIGNSIKDVIVEPARQHMIPGFIKVKENALKAGALGVTISGAGPSVIAFSKSSANLKKISTAMSNGFASADIKCQTVICKPSKGAADKRK
jgi:homoserine kinase